MNLAINLFSISSVPEYALTAHRQSRRAPFGTPYGCLLRGARVCLGTETSEVVTKQPITSSSQLQRHDLETLILRRVKPRRCLCILQHDSIPLCKGRKHDNQQLFASPQSREIPEQSQNPKLQTAKGLTSDEHCPQARITQ